MGERCGDQENEVLPGQKLARIPNNMKQIEYIREILIGITTGLLVFALSFTPPLQRLDRITYDLSIRLADREASDKVVVVAIDDYSIANLGRWPWSRDVHAALINILSQSDAKVIAHTVFFLEPQLEKGLKIIEDVLTQMEERQLFNLIAKINNEELKQKLEVELGGLIEELMSTRASLDSDAVLTASLQNAGNVILPILFMIDKPLGNPDQPLPPVIKQQQLVNVDTATKIADKNGKTTLTAVKAFSPLEPFANAAIGIGHLTVSNDIDGTTRFEPLVIDYYGTYIPSVAAQAVAKFLNLSVEDIRLQIGKSLKLGELDIGLDNKSRMNIFYYKDVSGRTPFQVESFYDVVTGRIPPQQFKDKIVLIGATAAGIGDAQVTVIDPEMPPVIALGHTISSLLNEDFLVTPEWSQLASICAFILVTIYLVTWVPRAGAAIGAITSGTLLLALMAFQIMMLITQSLWIPLMSPLLLLILGHTLLSTYGHLLTEKGKLNSDINSAESNRMLGLSFQGHGQLDMAFEKLMRCPLDERLMDLLYNLALDFERKRQFSKAGAVYQHMTQFDASYKDIEIRQQHSMAMDQSVILSTQQANGTLILENGIIEKPMLGRYEVVKELGKGAMGVVYLGRDPKIGRTVAIKTMALAQEFDEDALAGVMERFFREAETAGRLNHPNIVTIYDAGEDHDLAYIAMEFLKGCELTKYTKPDTLLPTRRVIMLMADAADALAYADGNNVVHRDVKPANVIYDPDTNKIKLTDFGIARITDASKTKTGTILGTPSYMSPEQFSGKKADGRSDIFSLGVMLFQLLTGKLPFESNSMAGLMFAITSSPHPDPLSLRPELPACICGILDVALSKNTEDRYENGYRMATELRQCAEMLKEEA